MKTILVPTQNIPTMKSTLEAAVLLAQRTGAYIEGVPLWFGVPEFVVSELASSFSMEIYRARREEGARVAGRHDQVVEQIGDGLTAEDHGVVAGWNADAVDGLDRVGRRFASRLVGEIVEPRAGRPARPLGVPRLHHCRDEAGDDWRR